MKTIDEMTDAQRAWILWKKLSELQNLLGEIYHFEFTLLKKREDLLTINPEDIPF
jgi:hypothetical protein